MVKLKILICASEYPPYTSGAGNVVYNTVKYFRQAGHICKICSPIGPDIKLCDSRVISLLSRVEIFYYLYSVIYYWWKARRYVIENTKKYDILVLHNINPLVQWNSQITGNGTFITLHTTYFGHYKNVLHKGLMANYYKYMTQLEQESLKNMGEDAIFICVSPSTVDELITEGVSKKRVRSISNGVDVNRFKPCVSKINLRKELDLPENMTILLSVGRITAQKNLFRLLEIFNRVQLFCSDLFLAIAGTGELLSDLDSFIKENNISNVRILGYVEDSNLPFLYACSDYFIISSYYEGQPLTLLEAMASGLPCIVSNIPNLSIVKDADCGIIVDFDDIEGASNTILSYINSKLCESHSINSRSYAENNLDWESVAKKYLKEFYSGYEG